MSKQYIYLGQLEYSFGGGLYTADGNEITDKKIGKTTVLPKWRESGINVNSPITYRNVAVWEVDDCTKAETALHRMFKPYRIVLEDGTKTEFFKDTGKNLENAIDQFLLFSGAGKRIGSTVPSGPESTPDEDYHVSKMNEATKVMYLKLKNTLLAANEEIYVHFAKNWISFKGPKRAFLSLHANKNKHGGWYLDSWNSPKYQELLSEFDFMKRNESDKWSSDLYSTYVTYENFDQLIEFAKSSFKTQL